MKISPARTAAYDILLRIERDGAFSSVLLPIYESNLNAKDRGLCHEIVLGVLRRKLYLDHVISLISNKERLDVEIATILRLALFQLVYLDRVPEHSAINESVNLAVRAKKTSAKGFVNGLLRSFLRDRPRLQFTGLEDRISVEESHPRWLVEQWIQEFGAERASEICKGNNESHALSFRPTRHVDALLSELVDAGEIRRSQYVPNCYLADRMTSRVREIADRADVYFQDEGSQLVAHAVIEVAGDRIIDVCAAPGGKTSMIARETEKLVIAGDFHFARVERLRETCRLHTVGVSVLQLDAEDSLPFELESFDTVFVDAPCSGTGTIRHNPEIRYSIRPNDLAGLAEKQLRILKNASELTASNGTLIYSTCSLESVENEGVVDEFLLRNDRFILERPNVPDRFLTDRGFARTFPDRDSMDGFFIAVFRRI
jgi:16S rRNA (cytosine967-C5)-methyltransferase